MSHTGGDANSSDRARGQGIKKSNFPAQTIIPGDATFDFVSAGHNFKITIADFLTALGVTGSIQQVGDSSDVPVLDDQGPVKGIRNIAAGFGISAQVDAQNSLEIATDFTFNEVGTTLVDDPSASAAIFRSLIAGPGINISSVPGRIQIASSEVPASTKTVVVAQKSDLPPPAAGIITLAANTHYLFVDDVSVGTDRFLLNNNVITAADGLIIRLTYTGTGDMFTAVGGDNKFTLIDLNCVNGALFNIDGLLTGTFIMSDVVISEVKSLGVLKDLLDTTIDKFNISEITTTGFLFTGTHGFFSCAESILNISAGIFLDLGTATFDAFSFVNSVFHPVAGVTMLSGLTDSGNINTGSLGTILNIQQIGTGTPLAGITSDDAQWQFLLNSDIADTRPDILLSLSAPETTTIAAVNTPVLLNGMFNTEHSSQFTITAAGRSTYNGVKTAALPITASFSLEPASGNNKDITLYIAINGVVQTNSGRKIRASAGAPVSTTLIWQRDFEPDDFMEVFVENNTDAIDILTSSGSERIN